MTRFAALVVLCASAAGCSSSEPARRVFATSMTYHADLGGLAGGDAACKAAADAATAAGLADFGGATWIAWLSDSRTDAIGRLPDDGNGWYRVDSTTPVFNNRDHVALAPAQLANTIWTDERGNTIPAMDALAWTGTAPGGTRDAATCLGWTNLDAFNRGTVGSAIAADDGWTADGQEGCQLAHRLICFER